MTDAWRKHRIGVWTLGVMDALLALGLLIVLVSADEDTDILVLLLSGVLTLAGVVTASVMLFRTLGTYGELSGRRWTKAAQVVALLIPVALILLVTIGPSIFLE